MRLRIRCAVTLLVLLVAGLPALPAGWAAPDQKERKEESKPEAKQGGRAEGKQEQEKREDVVVLKPESLQAQGIEVKAVQPRRISERLRVPAEVRFNETRRVVVSARVSGRAERVAVYANQRVARGQVLAELYSPEFLSVQNEYLLIARRAQRAADAAPARDSTISLADAAQRLRVLGATTEEIQTLEKTGAPLPLLPVHSPIEGVVLEHKLNAGDTVQPGQALYVIADPSSVWAQLALTEAQVRRVNVGQAFTLTVPAYPDRRFRGRIDSIAPQVDETTRTLQVRGALENPAGALKVGMFAQAEIDIGGGQAGIALPQEAVLRNPDGDWVVFIEQAPGRFVPQEVKVARNVGDQAVIEGLAPGTRVVTRGAFFVQSELAKRGFDTH